MTDADKLADMITNLDAYIQARAEAITEPRLDAIEAHAERKIRAAIRDALPNDDERRHLERLRAAKTNHGTPMTAHRLALELLNHEDLPVEIQRLGEPVEWVTRYPDEIALLAPGDEVEDMPL
jgi:hypothetical protein